jgi:hypothetical protein
MPAGNPAKRIAYWTGSAWKSLGKGISASVLALDAFSKSAVYAGGKFGNAGGLAAKYAAKWDGSAWKAMPGLNNMVYAMDGRSQSAALAGGAFTRPAPYIANWGGSNPGWVSLNSGLDGAVLAIMEDPATRSTIVGGEFLKQGKVRVNRIARLDNTTGLQAWIPMGSGFGGTVRALATDGRGVLYAGGDFLEADGKPAARVACWIDRLWEPFGF